MRETCLSSLFVATAFFVLSGCPGSTDSMSRGEDAGASADGSDDGEGGGTTGSTADGSTDSGSPAVDAEMPLEGGGGSDPTADADVDDDGGGAFPAQDGAVDAGTASSSDGGPDASNGGSDADAGDSCPSMTFGASCAPVTCQNGACDEGTCWGAQGAGTCDACDTGWAGDDCDVCGPGAFGATCEAVTCQNGTCGAGTCSGSSGDGHCDSCETGWVGEDCDMCGSGRFGATCEPVTCENGTCEPGTCSGPAGNGQCDACDDGWLGPSCTQICKPFHVESCYDGPDGTQDVGICRAGLRVCHQSGRLWSPCLDQVTPRAEDICSNDLDDNCSGSEADEVCDTGAIAVWVDAETGSDETGEGSHAAPFATLNRALQTGRKLLMVVADGDGTVYEEDLALSSTHGGITVSGWGPTRPMLAGAISMVHCHDCTFENMELAYPDVAEDESAPTATVRGVHNYRSVWRNVRFSAPHGLPADTSLYSTHHGYDNLFIDVEVDDVVLAPGAGAGSSAYTLLNAYDHGTGSQFTRVTVGAISFSGAVPETLDLTLIKAWGYCDQQPDAVTAVRNALITGLDMSGMATNTTSFQAIEVGCYLAFQEPAGFMLLNNTLADITATSVTFATLRLAQDMQTWISGNIVDLHSATTAIGLVSNRAATIDYSNFHDVTTPVSGSATLGSNMLAVDPGFVGGNDYRLGMDSACIDTGDPQLTDGDGTRSNMGSYGGPLAP